MKKDIQNEIKEIVKRMNQIYDSLSIYFFGSYAYGEPHDNSDLDLFIIVEKSELPHYKRSRKGYSLLHDIDIPVEFLVYTKDEVEELKDVPSSIVNTVLKKGVRLIY